MIIGQTVFGGTYFSPWFPRQGDGALFGAEALASTGTLVFQLYGKAADEADVSAVAVSASSNFITGGTVVTVAGTSLPQLVRFRYIISSSASNWVHFRVLPPAWRRNGA